MSLNNNPIVYRGTCANCGGEVTLSDRDAEAYIAAPHRGLTHFVCPEIATEDLESLPHYPGGDYGSDR